MLGLLTVGPGTSFTQYLGEKRRARNRARDPDALAKHAADWARQSLTALLK